jgi:hypothetical protein
VEIYGQGGCRQAAFQQKQEGVLIDEEACWKQAAG